MIISKMKPQNFQKSELLVDSWTLEHSENGEVKEEFVGKISMNKQDSLMYLGHVISKDDTNMPNIVHKRNKSIGTQKQILKLVKILGVYTFENAVIYMESLLRSSILYASETMNNVKEIEFRALEAIEESVLVKVFQTSRSCSRHLLYLEAGMTPARFQVKRQMLNLLKYILQQPSDSLMFRVFKSLENHPTRKDWLSTVKEILKMFKINLSLLQIQNMKTTKYKYAVKKQTRAAAFQYLSEKQENGKKGKLIIYKQLQMADYLLPDCTLSVSDKIQLFAIRCEMNDLPNNFGKTDICEICFSEPMNNQHLLNCFVLNNGEHSQLTYEQILNGNIDEKTLVLKKKNQLTTLGL